MPSEVLTVGDDSYQIDLDEPEYDEPALSGSPARAATSIADKSMPVKPVREKKVREPKPVREKKVREPKPAREKKVREPKPVREKKVREPKPPKTPKPPSTRTGDRDRIWAVAAGVVGAIGLLLSVILATGALFVALDAPQGSAFFSHLSNTCNALVGPLKDVFTFSGINADQKQALVGWGLGSMGYLLVGRFLQSVLASRVKGS